MVIQRYPRPVFFTPRPAHQAEFELLSNRLRRFQRVDNDSMFSIYFCVDLNEEAKSEQTPSLFSFLSPTQAQIFVLPYHPRRVGKIR